jgi:hypothetical protein
LRVWVALRLASDLVVRVTINICISSFPGDKDIRGDKEGFRALWKRIKAVDKPDEVRGSSLITISLTNGLGGVQGVPFDTHDSMFNPPTSRVSPFPNDSKLISGAEVPPSSNIAPKLVRSFTMLYLLRLNRSRIMGANIDRPLLARASSL